MALVLTLGGLIYLYLVDRAQSAELRRELSRLDRQVAASGAEQARLEAILRKPENSTVLDNSVFINTLLYHKGISWSRLFTDLENTIPYDVKLISLVPSINSRNVVVLDISVAAKEPVALLRVRQGPGEVGGVSRCEPPQHAASHPGGAVLQGARHGELCPETLTCTAA